MRMQIFSFYYNWREYEDTIRMWNPPTFCENGSSRPVVVNHLDVSEMDVAEEDAVGPSCCLAVVEGQGDDILEKSRIFKRLDRWIEVTLVWEVDTFQYGPLRVEQITFVALAGKAILCQAAVGTGAGPPTAAQVEAQLLAASVAPGARVRAFENPTHVQLLLCLSFCTLVITVGLYVTIHYRWKSPMWRSVGIVFTNSFWEIRAKRLEESSSACQLSFWRAESFTFLSASVEDCHIL